MENRETATKSFLLVTISNLFVNDDIKHLLLDEGFLTHLFWSNFLREETLLAVLKRVKEIHETFVAETFNFLKTFHFHNKFALSNSFNDFVTMMEGRDTTTLSEIQKHEKGDAREIQSISFEISKSKFYHINYYINNGAC